MPSGRPTYTNMLACCKAAYAGQVSGAWVCYVSSFVFLMLRGDLIYPCCFVLYFLFLLILHAIYACLLLFFGAGRFSLKGLFDVHYNRYSYNRMHHFLLLGHTKR